jgi:hypothetical protein
MSSAASPEPLHPPFDVSIITDIVLIHLHPILLGHQVLGPLQEKLAHFLNLLE